MAEYRIPFELGETVFLKVRSERIPGMVTMIHIYPGGHSYRVCWSNTATESTHYLMELDREHVPDYVNSD